VLAASYYLVRRAERANGVAQAVEEE